MARLLSQTELKIALPLGSLLAVVLLLALLSPSSALGSYHNSQLYNGGNVKEREKRYSSPPTTAPELLTISITDDLGGFVANSYSIAADLSFLGAPFFTPYPIEIGHLRPLGIRYCKNIVKKEGRQCCDTVESLLDLQKFFVLSNNAHHFLKIMMRCPSMAVFIIIIPLYLHTLN